LKRLWNSRMTIESSVSIDHPQTPALKTALQDAPGREPAQVGFQGPRSQRMHHGRSPDERACNSLGRIHSPRTLRGRPYLTALPVVDIERIMLRALCVPQRAANSGHERAATATEPVREIGHRATFCLVTRP
jgi:hypothetical protein